MKVLIRFVIMANIGSGIVVYLSGYLIPMLEAPTISDFFFYMAIVLWGIASLAWDGGRRSQTYDVDLVSQKMRTMVKGHHFDAEKRQHYRQNYSFGFSLFIAGAIPLLLSAALTWLH